MNINFIPINYTNLNDCAILAKWFNDPTINYLISPNFYQGELTEVTPEYISQLNMYPKNEKYAYFIVVNNLIVGDINIIDNPEYLVSKDKSTSWLGITVGEKAYRGHGVGKEAMKFIEKTARDLGFERMELGVFSFNTKAIKFYENLGYKHFATIPNFTFYNGQWYDDLRYEKTLI